MQFREQFLQEDREYLKSVAALGGGQPQNYFEADGTEEPMSNDLFMEVAMLKKRMSAVTTLQNTLDSLQIDIKRSKYDKLDLQIELKETQVTNNEISKRLNKVEPKLDEL